jgi:phosphoribosylanthranilate isomerase
MSLWIKICGNTSLDDARLAVEAGADAVGFVFAPSPRRVSMDEVSAITRHLPQEVERIGVFVDAALEEIEFAVRACRLTGVQVHSDSGPELPALLRARLGPLLRIVRVVHFSPDAATSAAAISLDPNVDAVLVDSRTATAVGGTGVAFDWDLAATSLFHNAKERRFIAAGGLSPVNVTEAVATLRPWGVDVSSGVEASPGRKDPEKVREFIAKALAAARAL